MNRFLILICLFFCSCSNRYLVVRQEKVDGSFLASSHVRTPDPRKKSPPKGQRLLVSWAFPKSLFDKELQMRIRVKLWDQSEHLILRDIKYRTDSMAYFIEDKTVDGDKRILTYLIEVIDPDGEIVTVWKHPLWFETLQIRSQL